MGDRFIFMILDKNLNLVTMNQLKKCLLEDRNRPEPPEGVIIETDV
jgi:hypothetical protein